MSRLIISQMKRSTPRDASKPSTSTPLARLLSNTNILEKRWHFVPRLLHVGIDFARCCINVRPALLRNGNGQEMLLVVTILVYH